VYARLGVIALSDEVDPDINEPDDDVNDVDDDNE
jgi:hypothetical protein